ncbi:MAG: hypothetical protein QME68_01450 [Elusimicrobiota bacterium]|nr:hypothetical protein [Elusimicrobiota bacterium]
MIRTAVFTFLVLLIALVVYLLVSSRPGLEVEIEKLKEEYLPKETLTLTMKIKNTAARPNYFFVDLKSDLGVFTPRTVFLKQGCEQKLTYLLNISTKTTQGIYPVNVSIKTRRTLPTLKPVTLLTKELNVVVKLPPTPPSPPPKPVIEIKKPKPLTGKVEFVNLPQAFIYNTTYYIKSKIENTSTRPAQFMLWLNISGPERANSAFSHIEQIKSEESKEKVFEYFVDRSNPEGEYFLTLELRDTETDALLASDAAVTKLIDNPPEITFTKLIVPAKKERKEKPIEFIYELKDDIEIKQAVLFFNDLTRNFSTCYNMILVSGNTSKGLWSTSFILPKKTKEFSYYIQATDSKGQMKSTEREEKISLLKE